MSFILDMSFKAHRLAYFVLEDETECPNKRLYVPRNAGAFSIVNDVLIQFGSDIGIRAFIIMMANFMLAVQFEGAISNLTKDFKVPNVFPFICWWTVTVLCGTAVNIVRFNWCYAAYKTNSKISSDIVTLYILMICIMFFTNPYVKLSPEFRIMFVVALMMITILAQNLGALTVPNTCEEAQTPEWNVRTGFQLALILIAFTILISIAHKRIYNIQMKKEQAGRLYSSDMSRDSTT